MWLKYILELSDQNAIAVAQVIDCSGGVESEVQLDALLSQRQ